LTVQSRSYWPCSEECLEIRAPVNVLSHVGAFVLLTCTAVASAQNLGEADFHPTDAQVKEMQQSCAVNEAGILTLQQKVSAAISDWSKATVGARPAAAMKHLEEFFDRVRNDGHLSGRKSIYVLCVDKALRQFVEARREQPQALAGSGNSKPLQLSSFSSEEEIWRSGCRQAEDDAVSNLQSRCGDRTFVVVNSQCPQGSGSVRTYTAEVQGECRDK
jgi:hypothetical protein